VLLKTLWVQRGVVDSAAPAGTTGNLALSNGTVLDLISLADAPPISNAVETTVFTQWAIDFEISQDQHTALTVSPAVAIKSEVANQPVQFEIPKKKAKKLQSVAQCLSDGER
jgi:hypothetical protein